MSVPDFHDFPDFTLRGLSGGGVCAKANASWSCGASRPTLPVGSTSSIVAATTGTSPPRSIHGAWRATATTNGAKALASFASVPSAFSVDDAQNGRVTNKQALKAVLVAMAVEFPRTHDLQQLVGPVEDAGLIRPPGGAGRRSRAGRWSTARQGSPAS